MSNAGPGFYFPWTHATRNPSVADQWMAYNLIECPACGGEVTQPGSALEIIQSVEALRARGVTIRQALPPESFEHPTLGCHVCDACTKSLAGVARRVEPTRSLVQSIMGPDTRLTFDPHAPGLVLTFPDAENEPQPIGLHDLLRTLADMLEDQAADDPADPPGVPGPDDRVGDGSTYGEIAATALDACDLLGLDAGDPAEIPRIVDLIRTTLGAGGRCWSPLDAWAVGALVLETTSENLDALGAALDWEPGTPDPNGWVQPGVWARDKAGGHGLVTEVFVGRVTCLLSGERPAGVLASWEERLENLTPAGPGMLRHG